MKGTHLAHEWLFVVVLETEQVVLVQWGCLLQISSGKVIPRASANASLSLGNAFSLPVQSRSIFTVVAVVVNIIGNGESIIIVVAWKQSRSFTVFLGWRVV